MALSKKHYEQFAERFQQQVAEVDGNETYTDIEKRAARQMLTRLAAKMAIDFKYDNARFDKLRFLAACGF